MQNFGPSITLQTWQQALKYIGFSIKLLLMLKKIKLDEKCKGELFLFIYF